MAVTFNPLIFTGLDLTGNAGGGAGDVSGPGSSTDTAIPRWDGTTGTALSDSGLLISDTNNLLFSVDGDSDIGSDDDGVTFNRPDRLYVKSRIDVGDISIGVFPFMRQDIFVGTDIGFGLSDGKEIFFEATDANIKLIYYSTVDYFNLLTIDASENTRTSLGGTSNHFIWENDGGGDIGSYNAGVTFNRPGNLYLKESIFNGGSIFNSAGNGANPSYTFFDYQDVGFYGSSNAVNFAIGGSTALSILRNTTEVDFMFPTGITRSQFILDGTQLMSDTIRFGGNSWTSYNMHSSASIHDTYDIGRDPNNNVMAYRGGYFGGLGLGYAVSSSPTIGNNILWGSDGLGNIGADGDNRPDTVYVQNAVVNGIGSETNPSYTFDSDIGTGFYSSGINNVDISTNGANVGNISSSGAWTVGPVAGGVTHRLNSNTSAAGADLLTLTNGPTGTAGDPDIYITININGTDYAFPGWAV